MSDPSPLPSRGNRETTEPVELLHPRRQRLAVSKKGMAATAHDDATEAAVAILEAGGNAIDAAAAAAFALGVCEPAASGLGGQTMILLRDARTRKTIALDGSSRAPNRATPGSLSSADRLYGYRATTVPSTPATLAYAVRRYGRLPLADVLAPAIRLAEKGTKITELQQALTKRERTNLKDATAAQFFLQNGRRTPRVGATLRQPILAKTLRRLARKGIQDFYTGKIARMIEEDMIAHDGLIRRDDLAQIPWPIERRPLFCHFEGWRVATFPPPGAGRTLVEMLNILSHIPPRRRDPDTPEGAMLLCEVIRHAFRDRKDRPFDPNFYSQVEEKKMLSPEHAQRLARQIRRRLAMRGETTHLSVMDRDGNAVALTQSIERVYGACVATPGLGFLYNNYMSAFEYKDISHPYYLRPNAVPWASVAPTIVYRGTGPWLAIGSPGSERITPSIVQVLLRLQWQTPMDAVDAPRLHCSLDGVVNLEASRMRTDIPDALRARGYTVKERDPYSFYLGCIQLAMREGKSYIGVADPRRDGSARGPRK